MTNKIITLKRGLKLPISGEPEQAIYDGPPIKTVAVVGSDFHGMKPTMLVNVGDHVQVGQALFEDKKNPGVLYTAPASGQITDIHRGVRRVLQAVVIQKDAPEEIQHRTFEHYSAAVAQDSLDGEALKALLIESGLWTAFRTRPFSKVPALDSKPQAIFVNAMDTNPLAADPSVVIRYNNAPHMYRDWFEAGLEGVAKLGDALGSPKLFLAHRSGCTVPTVPGFNVHEFDGPHPAGLVGTHIHFLYPVDQQRVVWHLSYQDVIAIGHLLKTSRLWTDRIIALAGPEVEKPRLLRVPLGASVDELTRDQLTTDRSSSGEVRRISGSVFSGRNARAPFSYVGRYHLQVSVLHEGRERHFLEYLWPGARKHSATGAFLSRFLPERALPLTTNTNGSERGMVPVGAYERVMPLDILPTQLLRSLIVTDTEMAQALGCLELDEEDLGLCTYVCPGKYEYGPLLRDNLTQIEREG